VTQHPLHGSTDEEFLAGNVAGVVRTGATVRRTVGPWTPAVHDLLAHLESRIGLVPRVYGFDDRGREVLDFMPGRVLDVDHEALSDAQLVSLVSWARRFHEAVSGFTHDGPWRYFPIPMPTLIGHNDLAPYNVCFDGDELCGVFDWDLAGPTTPLDELAFMAWNCVPLTRDIDPDTAAQRLRLMASTYGGVEASQILGGVPQRIDIMLEGIPAAAADGDPGMAALMDLGEPARSRQTLTELITRMPDIAARL